MTKKCSLEVWYVLYLYYSVLNVFVIVIMFFLTHDLFTKLFFLFPKTQGSFFLEGEEGWVREDYLSFHIFIAL